MAGKDVTAFEQIPSIQSDGLGNFKHAGASRPSGGRRASGARDLSTRSLSAPLCEVIYGPRRDWNLSAGHFNGNWGKSGSVS